MKFHFANLELRKDASVENIGDYAQILAIDNIYNYLNISQNDIFQLPIEKISTYRGEKLILPINFPLFGLYNLSADIIPVYLGISMINGIAASGLRMQDYQPVGCRDKHTLEELKKIGIDAYYGGCLTITFPKRKKTSHNGMTYIADVSEEIYDLIPACIKRTSKFIKHVLFGNNIQRGKEAARTIYDEYKDNASLIITSKIHCAQPCIAMGIPTIFICDEKSFRYDVIKNYIPIYTVEDCRNNNINWNPPSIDLEEQKKILIENAVLRIETAVNSITQDKNFDVTMIRRNIKKVNDLFDTPQNEQPYKIDMISSFANYINNRYSYESEFEYGIWGISQFAYSIYQWMNENYPKSHLNLVIDRDNSKTFYGISPKPIEAMKDYPNPIFMTAPSAVGIAKDTFAILNVKKYIVCYSGVHIEDEKIIQA